jgi:hypothetical protein
MRGAWVVGLLAIVLCGCATTPPPGTLPTPNNLANVNSATVGQVGGLIGLILTSSPLGPVIGTGFGVAVGDLISGYFKQPNTLTGTVWMPMEAAPVKLTMTDPRASVPCPPGYTCTPVSH